MFWRISTLGKELRELHLFEFFNANPTWESRNQLCGSGDNRIRKTFSKRNTGYELLPKTNGAIGRIWINDTQFFDAVPKEVWTFFVGGYQPAQQWLKSKKRDWEDPSVVKKDRRTKSLTENDIRHYQKILFVLQETLRYMEKIDTLLYPK